MQRTKIEYLTHTWNPIAMRCTQISPGCEHCWHLAMAKRLAGNPRIVVEFRNAYGGAIDPVLIHTEVEAPLHLKKPARIGTQFMGDIFHEDVTKGFIDAVWSTMAEARHHIFMILTKRPKRLLAFMKDRSIKGWKADWNNIWLGVTVCNQPEADEKIPILLQIPAAHRWVSYEPGLGSVDLTPWIYEGHREAAGFRKSLDWVVCGGLSLPGGKVQPPKKEWVDSLIAQCDAAGVPLFIKPNAQYPVERRDFP